ncbi:DUF58 domain-containing protein [Aureliella helgolandensis]|uniref:VWFA domain-containing protein n=1 Tax=Aureliella helgolandensis TaxID=2527968 RepID=A0A518G6Y0_9BACT|nr:DUF58 domain-containing protein [Aureliella helgolandensis]QDV24348.1 hypothetical protein Q31a_26640 [Aureliella helgolandensis]
MPASKRFLPPEAVKRVQRLELQARQIVEGFLSGSHRSPYFGQSVEFVQHRQYVPGDDVRHVDWKVWARQDRLVIKQYEEDTNLRCTLLIDSSASMSYGHGAATKFEYAAVLAACLALLVLKQQDAVGSVLFDNRIRGRVPLRTSQKHLTDILASLESTSPADKTDLDSVFRDVVQTFPKRGLMILISDLLGAEESALRGIDTLRRAGHDVMVLHLLHDDELDFPFTDPTRFEGLESSDHLTCNPRALREGYMAALERFLDRTRRTCAASNSDYMLVRTSDAPDAVLSNILNSRMHSVRR